MSKRDPQLKDKILGLYRQDFSSKEIAGILQIGKTTVIRNLAELNIHYKFSDSRRKNKLNESYFDLIDTDEKAYFLGMLYADGCNKFKKRMVTLFLTEKDKGILDRLNRFVHPDKNLSYFKGKEGGNPLYGITICSKHICERLSELGVVENKTFKIEFPEWLSKSLYSSFIRGYFDGDGGVTIHKNDKNYFKDSANITGTQNFCEFIKCFLKEELNLNSYIYDRHPLRKTNIRTLTVSGRLNVIKLSKFLYKNSDLYLERKKEKFLTIEKRYEKQK